MKAFPFVDHCHTPGTQSKTNKHLFNGRINEDSHYLRKYKPKAGLTLTGIKQRKPPKEMTLNLAWKNDEGLTGEK